MELLTHLAAAASGSLVSAVWEGLVLAACVAICLRLLPGMTAAARSVVWSVVMVLAVALPFAHLSGGAAISGAGWRVDERVSLAIAAVWILLSIVRAAQLVRSALYLRGIARSAVPVEVGAELAAVLSEHSHGRRDEAASNMGHPVLCVSEDVDRPCVVGFSSPRILIPASLMPKLTDGELMQIVLHEMEHLRRGDDWTNLLQKLSLVLFPLNPVLLWIERQLCLERELACDDQVLRTTKARKAYAACLANLAEHSLVRRGVSLALGAWERQSEVVRRVHRILLRPDREMGRRQVVAVVGVMVAGMVAGADALAHSPQLVSFGPKIALTASSADVPVRMPGVAAQDVVFRPQAFPRGLKPADAGRGNGATEVAPLQNRIRFKAHIVKRAPVQMAEVREDQRAQSGATVVLFHRVTWQEIAPGVMQRSLVSYAAVPTGNGWLFLQL
jgi:beta-lactamase regulating signal transducer with metallopeptidase domain